MDLYHAMSLCEGQLNVYHHVPEEHSKCSGDVSENYKIAWCRVLYMPTENPFEFANCLVTLLRLGSLNSWQDLQQPY